MLHAQGYDKKALSEQVFGNTSCEGGEGQFGKLPCELDSDEALDQTKLGNYRNIMQIVWLVIPGVGPGYRGAGPWPGVGVPQQRRASVAAVAVARP